MISGDDRMSSSSSSSLLLRLVLILSAALATDLHLISGLELEENRGPFEERFSSIGRSIHPQIYNLHLEPVRKGASFDLVQPEQKRSRLFVGKRVSDDDQSDDEDLILLSSSEDSDQPFGGVKRSHLFVGRRASPRFVGKRSVTNQPTRMTRMTRKRRFASNDAYLRRNDGKMEDSSDEGRMWKLWMTAGTGEEENAAAEKRSRMFVGKRRQSEADDQKRSRLFVGRRAEAEDDDEEEEKRNSGIALPAEVELSEGAEKRSRLFVGKRHPLDHPSSHSSEPFGTEEKEEPGDIPSPPGVAGESADKRLHLFPGKRPAPGFVGKRED